MVIIPIMVKIKNTIGFTLKSICIMNLLIDTEISGIKRNRLNVKLRPENKIVSRNVCDRNNKTLNNCQCHNRDRS